jgi:hypothetical protein
MVNPMREPSWGTLAADVISARARETQRVCLGCVEPDERRFALPRVDEKPLQTVMP